MNTIEIRKILGISRAEFGRRYGIPIRTLEDWDHGRRKPPEWVLTLLQRVVTIDAEAEKENNCTSERTEKVDN